MDSDELERALAVTLHDGRLSRTERQALTEVVKDARLSHERLVELRAHAFKLARERINDPRAMEALDWVEDLVKLLAKVEAAPAPTTSRAYFSPGDACLSAIVAELERVKTSADICVFTITDDRISRTIAAAHERGVRVRIITDNDKQFDEGSDVERLGRLGVPFKVDETEHHMHHKFAVLDGARLLNGSYNWTRSAAAYNEENLVITSDPTLVAVFTRHFAEMWAALA